MIVHSCWERKDFKTLGDGFTINPQTAVICPQKVLADKSPANYSWRQRYVAYNKGAPENHPAFKTNWMNLQGGIADAWRGDGVADFSGHITEVCLLFCLLRRFELLYQRARRAQEERRMPGCHWTGVDCPRSTYQPRWAMSQKERWNPQCLHFTLLILDQGWRKILGLSLWLF